MMPLGPSGPQQIDLGPRGHGDERLARRRLLAACYRRRVVQRGLDVAPVLVRLSPAGGFHVRPRRADPPGLVAWIRLAVVSDFLDEAVGGGGWEECARCCEEEGGDRGVHDGKLGFWRGRWQGKKRIVI